MYVSSHTPIRWTRSLIAHNMLQVCPAYCVVLVRTSHSLHTVFTARSLVQHHSHMNLCNRYGFSHAQVSNRPLPILPFTAMLNVTMKEQPDVTSRQSNSFALVCNWLIELLKRNNRPRVALLIIQHYCRSVQFLQFCF